MPGVHLNVEARAGYLQRNPTTGMVSALFMLEHYISVAQACQPYIYRTISTARSLPLDIVNKFANPDVQSCRRGTVIRVQISPPSAGLCLCRNLAD